MHFNTVFLIHSVFFPIVADAINNKTTTATEPEQNFLIKRGQKAHPKGLSSLIITIAQTNKKKKQTEEESRR